MKNYIPIDALNTFVKKRKLEVFIDKVSFKQLFIAWFIIVLAMGFIYYYSADSQNYLAYQQSSEVVDLVDSLYFSFITATSTGYGDIIPMGLNKLLSIIQVIFSLALFAIATSKLISIK